MDVLSQLERPGPFVTVYSAAPAPSEHADDVAHIETKQLARSLTDQGAPDELVERAMSEVRTRLGDGGATCVLVDGDGAVAGWNLPSSPVAPLARFGPLPSLLPLIEARRRQPPHLVVLVDRTGADLGLFVDGELRSLGEVEGDDLHVQRSQPGGWSQRRFQQRAENAWEHNAGLVADEVVDITGRHRVRCVFVAGDERAAALLEGRLPEDVRGIVHHVEGGGRAADGGEDVLAERLGRALASVSASDTADLLARFTDRRDGQGTAADGTEQTTVALRRALVETLLVHDDPDDDRTVFVALDAPPVVSVDAGEIEELGARPTQVRLIDGLVWAAHHGGVEVRVVPSHGASPADGVGALLRAPRSALVGDR